MRKSYLWVCFWFVTSLFAGEKKEFLFKYEVEILPKRSGKVSVWMPFPSSFSFQKVKKWEVFLPSHWEWKLYRESKYGNRYLYFWGAGEKGKAVQLGYRAEIVRWEVKEVKEEKVSPLFLRSNQKVPVGHPKVRRHLERALLGEKREGKGAIARKVYDYLLCTMRYDKSGIGWGRGDVLWACDALRGNCTDFHSLFIAMMRTLGVPAKFEIGFSIPQGEKGEILGYHCWAWFYHGKRWIPVDISEAWKYPAKREYYFGTLDADRISLTVGRDLELVPSPKAQRVVNFFIFPIVELGGKAHGFRKRVFFERREARP